MPKQELLLDPERLVNDYEIRRALAKSLKGFCATYLAQHFPAAPSDCRDSRDRIKVLDQERVAHNDT